jgi:glycosyltransferase involved in cell wall biosynthesis
MKKCKIVMMTMFKNESTVIKRMLDSCLPYVDYYVMQNNGSTDGTDEIAKQFLIDNKLSGEIYNVEEGWVGFGWNRDHLIQYCQNTDHGCDWILKMDCDEVLEIDNGFDWSVLDNKKTQAFHIPAVSGSSVYYRAWMWNAKMPWRFNHDTCHETIYTTLDNIGENFERVDLPTSFRQIGYNEGQSWSNPTKFISDALILEEKMIKEGTMLSDLYHFWYIGKSYFDAWQSHSFPLGDSQKKEFARRCIYYFKEFINYTNTDGHIDEMSYMGMIFSAECYKFLGDIESSISTYKQSETFAPGRNDHLFALALIYQELNDYDNMLVQTTKMMQPERTNAFPQYVSFIDTSMYHDSSSKRVQSLHEIALNNTNKKIMLPFYINQNKSKKLFVVDNFYYNPDEVRNFALNVEYQKDLRWYKGLRSTQPYRPDGIKEVFESIIGEKISNFEEHGFNGCFQICTAEDPQVYHFDLQKWAAMIYLTPNAPLESGTRLHKSKINGTRHSSESDVNYAFSGGFYDSTKFDIVDNAGNLYNRLVIMDARCIHSAGPYFGQGVEDGRLTHLFFFD